MITAIPSRPRNVSTTAKERQPALSVNNPFLSRGEGEQGRQTSGQRSYNPPATVRLSCIVMLASFRKKGMVTWEISDRAHRIELPNKQDNIRGLTWSLLFDLQYLASLRPDSQAMVEKAIDYIDDWEISVNRPTRTTRVAYEPWEGPDELRSELAKRFRNDNGSRTVHLIYYPGRTARTEGHARPASRERTVTPKPRDDIDDSLHFPDVDEIDRPQDDGVATQQADEQTAEQEENVTIASAVPCTRKRRRDTTTSQTVPSRRPVDPERAGITTRGLAEARENRRK